MFLKDRSMLNKTYPINPPSITNKGREGDREVGIDKTTNLKGEVNNPTLLTTMELMPLHKTPSIDLDWEEPSVVD